MTNYLPTTYQLALIRESKSRIALLEKCLHDILNEWEADRLDWNGITDAAIRLDKVLQLYSTAMGG